VDLDEVIVQGDQVGADPDGAGGRDGVAGIGGKVDEDLLDLARVGRDDRIKRGELDPERDVFLQEHQQKTLHLLDDAVETYRFGLDGGLAAEAEQGLGQVGGAAGRLQDLVHVLGERVALVQSQVEQAGVPDDGGQ